MRSLDLVVILLYLVAIAAVGLRLSGRQGDARAYFIGERDLPWWAICFSIVATETSTLTVISVPGVAYLGAFGFVELAIGYIIGRSLVAVFLLPLYMREGFVSCYQYLRERFGPGLQGVASVTFLVTRLLAEGVRLFASAIPIKLLLDAIGLPASYIAIIAALSAVTVLYTYVGGIRAVIWTDAVQMLLYLGGAVACIAILLGEVGGAGLSQAWGAGKFQVLNFTAPVLTSPFNAVAAIVGGALFGMASHGTDQLMVQRVLAARSLADGRRAIIGSGVVVAIQFALFSLVGTLLWVHLGGRSIAELGLRSSDDLFPRFILDELPPGVSGLLIAGILSATMGSLSSALNSMANSTVADLLRAAGRQVEGRGTLALSRGLTVVWAVVMAGFASLFTDTKDQVVLLGLGIAGYTYGALLGAFLLGRLVPRAHGRDAVAAFLATLAVMSVVVGTYPLAFTWYVPLGVIVTLLVGGLLSLTHERARVAA
ncbi:MAG: sodium:solute symporter [Janthinobacterium lividum]